MSNNDKDYERLKADNFADAKPVSAFPHLVKHQLERLHRLNVPIADDLVQWLSQDVSPSQYAEVMNSALREFRNKKAA